MNHEASVSRILPFHCLSLDLPLPFLDLPLPFLLDLPLLPHPAAIVGVGSYDSHGSRWLRALRVDKLHGVVHAVCVDHGW